MKKGNIERTKELLQKIISLSREDWKKNWDKKELKSNKKEDDPKRYFKLLEGEMAEAMDELKLNNKIYLTDELGDMLWVYISILAHLKELGYIDSMEDVFEGAYKKFGQRSCNVKKVKDFDVPQMIEKWNETKIIQKKNNLKKHQRYVEEMGL